MAFEPLFALALPPVLPFDCDPVGVKVTFPPTVEVRAEAFELSFACAEPAPADCCAKAGDAMLNAKTSAEADPKSVYLVIWYPFEWSTLPWNWLAHALERVLLSGLSDRRRSVRLTARAVPEH